MSLEFSLPANTCDCHFHVFGGSSLPYPYTKKRSYTPVEASLDKYLSVIRPHGISRFVLVQPSVYGLDNSLHLDSLKQLGDSARAVVVLDADVSDDTLQEMHALGVRGVRFNLLFQGGPEQSVLEELAPRLRKLNWHAQILMDVGELPQNAEVLTSLGVPLVFDHFGHFSTQDTAGRVGFDALLKLLQQGIAWVKLSAPYRFALGGLPYEELQEITTQLIAANQNQLLWGSDWPHPACPETPCSIEEVLFLLFKWVEDKEVVRKILVENPERLYDFE